MHTKNLYRWAILGAWILLAGCASAPAQETTLPTTQAPTVTSSEVHTTAPAESDSTTASTDHLEHQVSTAEGYVKPVIMEETALSQEAAALEEALQPAQSVVLHPQASGELTSTNNYATVDYSHTEDGYVMVNFTAPTDKKVKAQVIGPTATYTYNLTPGEWTTFPLSDGNGSYGVKVYENVVDKRYAQVLSVNLTATLSDEFAPFIRPNQYVNYENADATIAMAAQLTRGTDQLLNKVAVIYDYVVNNITYDYDKAATVQSGYLPDLDAVLADRKGICFDYASLMTGMLRSQGVPCKLVVGYAGSVYHAWISVWSEATGWIDGAVYFNGTSWQRLDPTFASSGKGSQDIQEFIGNGENYTSKYIY